MEKYDHFLDALKGIGGNHALHSLLRSANLDVRVEFTQRTFLVACNECDDDAALKLFSLLMKAVNDLHVVHFAHWENRQLLISQSKEVDEAKLKALSEKLKMTMDLLEKIPFTQKVGFPEIQHSGGPLMKTESVPALIKTRKAMLELIATRWKETKDETEADKLFNFMVNFPKLMPDYKMLEDIIRKVTDNDFPQSRITRSILSLKNSVFGYIVPVLSIARARNQDNLFEELKVLQLLEGCSEDAYERVKEFAQHTAECDSDASALLNYLVPEGLDGKVSFFLGYGFVLEISKKEDWSQEKAEYEVSRIISSICDWKKRRLIHYRISLHFYVHGKDGNPPKLIFEKDEKI